MAVASLRQWHVQKRSSLPGVYEKCVSIQTERQVLGEETA